jgi:hypothetical protein
MRTIVPALFVLLALCLPCAAQVKSSTWNGFEKLDFTVAGRPCSL